MGRLEIESGSVTIKIKGKAEVWIDGVGLGKIKKKKVSLEAGEHLFRFGIGSKSIEANCEVEAGQRYQLSINPKKPDANCIVMGR